MDKKPIRGHMRELNRSLSSDLKAHSAEKIMHAIEQNENFKSAQIIALYCSLDDEPPTKEMIQKWSKSKQIALPKVEGDTIQFYSYSTTNTAIGAFGIEEPINLACPISPSSIDLMVVPGVAFTTKGDRLGRGKGYYDKYLSKPEFHAHTIGVGFPHQIVDNLPTESHDILLDEIICL